MSARRHRHTDDREQDGGVAAMTRLNSDFHTAACAKGGYRDMREMLKEGAELSRRNGTGREALHLATVVTDPRNVLVLLHAGAKIDSRDEAGDTPLHWAAYHKNRTVMEVLIRKGAPLDAVNDDGNTPAEALRKMMNNAVTRSVAPATPEEAADFEAAIQFLENARRDKLILPFTQGTKTPVSVRPPLAPRRNGPAPGK